ncbi:hypothetical protein JQU17_17765 [Ponticoccus sp. SC2-23]|nr:hypothetical protein [Ponticoccus sp. SC6-9]MBM1235745.1 hypothetical protein [Ponticoccus sp. SC6-45]MBM1240025.1 hypothetical protein [Ponticoccus sp. SC6-49]MBM1253680.1 hypothetical protein [Ponticoccus sp. SC6-33]MBM1258033.1 hypothetical protein [Ponticoccus sp. SC6-60]MBM1262699.1 hypothetical protein [Ponticoccus sp. SC6-31]MBM1267048.1 hypothetical protein [Ponticoccus sp. SC2-67]MBM1271667.1 hypothetical protein [Ponticoccus sp. SC2-37]MBM1276050.1 hypothetical protein [Pontico
MSDRASFDEAGATSAPAIAENTPDMSLRQRLIIQDSPAVTGITPGNIDLLQQGDFLIFQKKPDGEPNPISIDYSSQTRPDRPTL